MQLIYRHLSNTGRHAQNCGFWVGVLRRTQSNSAPARRAHVLVSPSHSTPLRHIRLSQHSHNVPENCPGCGAYGQRSDPQAPGFFGSREDCIHAHSKSNHSIGQHAIYLAASKDAGILGQAAKGSALSKVYREGASNLPSLAHENMCYRCHEIVHHSKTSPLNHPTLKTFSELLDCSNNRINHVYHIIDAADFPMSLIPAIQQSLSLGAQRAKNRRSKTLHFHHGKIIDLSFIITRSDLLAPKKEQVDQLMPYLTSVLRDALGNAASNVRLGNVHCVSAHRGWWTKELSKEIFDRGGATWMVGKVNVGKSRLLVSVFPKGSLRSNEKVAPNVTNPSSVSTPVQMAHETISDLALDGLFPPVQPEIAYPKLPIFASLPGTTAAPIRIPFGCGRGELIDLPGLSRGSLATAVPDSQKSQFFMSQRSKPRQFSIGRGSSLLVGGIIRVTPIDPDLIILAYPFVPVHSCLTASNRPGISNGQETIPDDRAICKSSLSAAVQSAGSFALKWDVTKERAGPLTRKAAAGLSSRSLPFIVFSADILIEGCGWIELVAQVRRRRSGATSTADPTIDEQAFPCVEIWSPAGQHIGVRRPMCASLRSGDPLSRKIKLLKDQRL